MSEKSLMLSQIAETALQKTSFGQSSRRKHRVVAVFGLLQPMGFALSIEAISGPATEITSLYYSRALSTRS